MAHRMVTYMRSYTVHMSCDLKALADSRNSDPFRTQLMHATAHSLS